MGRGPGGGVITGIGRIAGRDWMIVANDATVKAGAFFPITAKKVIRAQTIALENRIPTVYLVDSAGVFLPLQDEVFPDQDDFGRIFYLNARMSALGIPQISAIMGNCVAGGAYLPVMTDVLIMTEGSGLYLAGPALVKAAIGQEVTSEELGGARMHYEVSGTVDFYEPTDEAALARIRELAALYPPPRLAPWAEGRKAPKEPLYPIEDLYGLVSPDGSRPYDLREVIARLVDGSEFLEYKGGTARPWSRASPGSGGTRWASWATSASSSRSGGGLRWAGSSTPRRRTRRPGSSSRSTRWGSPSSSSRT